MSSRKNTGSYYTPTYLSSFIMHYLARSLDGKEYISILEPSIGDGSFLRAFNNTEFPKSLRNVSFTGVDMVGDELQKAKSLCTNRKRMNCSYEFVQDDFLNYQKTIEIKFSVIVGNPPYIKKQLLSDQQVAWCNEIHRSSLLSDSNIKNIWTAFLIRACTLLENDGILAFVLPAELLQVNFSKELRDLLVNEFERTEIFTFDDLLFDCKGQDTVVLFAYKKHKKHGQYYVHIKNVNQLANNDFLLTQNSALKSGNVKWSHHWLPAADLAFLEKKANKLSNISSFCDSKPGVVTAANDFFIVNDDVEAQFDLQKLTRPIIQKALYVNGSVVFRDSDLEKLAAQGKSTKLIAIDDQDILSQENLRYLAIGENKDLQSGYKCSKRKKWYIIPNISKSSDGFFFRRSHHYPKLIKNEASVLVTDTAYKIDMKTGYEINSLIYSFYNSLSIVFAELEGRYYGGGLLELTPAEFKKIPIPYTEIDNSSFRSFADRFENKESITSILARNDEHLLKNVLGWSSSDIIRIQDIYVRIYNKRFRKE